MGYKETVRNGYNAIANQYLETRAKKSTDVALLDDFTKRLQSDAKVLDAGCGAGIPVAEILSRRFDVTGVDFSEMQVDLARKNIPDATFICQDMTQLDFPSQTFDGICSFYAIIHIPREEHRGLLENFYRMLKPGGVALLCLGAEDLLDDIEEDFHGNRMYWSHYDAATYESMLAGIGFNLIFSKIITDETYGGKHQFILAQKGSAAK
jgi:ubiquinone/menaquinone biosynthesis C-methylase UbiE